MKQDKNRPENGEETVVGSVDKRTEEMKGKKISWKQVVLGGVPGVLIGATPVLFSNAASASEIEESLPEEEGSTGEGEYRLDSVNDEMSFGEAFAAARAELGAGGVFEWRGNLYGTYTADEWNELHPEEAAEADDVDVAQTVTPEPAGEEPAAPEQGEPAAEDEPAPAAEEPAVEVAEADGMPDEPVEPAEPAGAGDDEVVILGVSNVEMEDGSEVVVGSMTVDGNEVVVIDVDNDGVFDGMIADTNGDGTIDASEVIDIQDSGLTVEQFAGMAEAESEPELADEGGYSNEIG